MKAHLKQLTSDSAVYGISNVLGRFVTFLLVPFYTNMLPRDEYGIVIVVYSWVAFLNAVFTFGLEPAYMRFVAGTDESRKSRVFSTAFFFILVGGSTLAILLLLFGDGIRGVLEIRDAWSAILPLSLGMVVLDAANAIPFAALRMEHRAKSFAAIKLTSILINVSLNVLFLAFLHWSIVAIFISGLLASLSSTLLLLPSIFSRARVGADRGLLRELLTYGLPTMPGAIAIMLIEIIDKPIMLKLTDAETVGVYGTNYKLGIFMMLVVTVFRYAWQPLYLQMSDNPEAKRLFARVLTYFVFLGSAIVLILSLFMGDIVRIPLSADRTLIAAEYWAGLGIVPIVLFSYLLAGMAQILNAGLYIQKKTMIILYATVTAAAVNVGVNLALIPSIGMYGGALATFAAYATLVVVYWFAGRRIYPTNWEIARLLRIGLALGIAGLLWYGVPAPDFLGQIVWKLCIVSVFFVAIGLGSFFTKREKEELANLFRPLRRQQNRPK